MKLFGTGFAQRIQGMDFDPSCDYRACLICGAVYQSKLDRSPVAPQALTRAMRQRWADKHAKTHPELEHKLLRVSGMSMTPAAANKLAAFGLLPISDMMSDLIAAEYDIADRGEVLSALFESSPIPIIESED